jgi:hypothetical protein
VSPLKTKLTFRGLRQLLLPRRPNSSSADTEFIQPQGSRCREIPTVPTELERVQDQVREVFTKLAKIDFDAAMTRAFEGMDRLTHSPALNNSLRSLEHTMPKFDEAVVNIRRLAVTLDKNTSSERLPFSKERSTRID